MRTRVGAREGEGEADEFARRHCNGSNLDDNFGLFKTRNFVTTHKTEKKSEKNREKIEVPFFSSRVRIERVV